MKGFFDFRSGPERERDYQDFTERVFSGGLPHKRKVRARLSEVLGKKDVTYIFLYYVALKDLLLRRPKLTFEEGMKQVCSEIRVMKLGKAETEAIRQVLGEDQAGMLS